MFQRGGCIDRRLSTPYAGQYEQSENSLDAGDVDNCV